MACCNFICENYKVDSQKVVLSTIVNVFFNNKRKTSTAPVRKDNLASFKKQKRETIFLWYSLVIILYLLLCTLSYFPPRSVLIFQSFLHPQLTYFATPLKIWGGKFWKVCQKGQLDIDLLPTQWKRNFEKFVRISDNYHQTTHPPVMWEHAITILCTMPCLWDL